MSACSLVLNLLPLWNEYFQAVETAEEEAFARVRPPSASRSAETDGARDSSSSSGGCCCWSSRPCCRLCFSSITWHMIFGSSTSSIRAAARAGAAVSGGLLLPGHTAAAADDDALCRGSQGLEPPEVWPPWPWEKMQPACWRSLWATLRDLATFAVRWPQHPARHDCQG